MNEIKVNEAHYIAALEKELEMKTKENLMLKAYMRQSEEENNELIRLYNESQNNLETTEETEGEKEG